MQSSLSYAKLKLNRRAAGAMAEATFDFQMADRQIRRIAALTCENHHNQFCVASPLISRCGTRVLARALRGIQSPVGEKTEISLL
jgi:hypothetical protein